MNLLPAVFALGFGALGLGLGLGAVAAIAEQSVLAARPVVTLIVTPEAVQSRRYPGIVTAANEVTLAFQTGGLLLEREADTGDVLAAGQVIAKLDPVSLQEDTLAARASLRGAEAQAENARQTYERVKKLRDSNIAAPAHYDAAKAALDMTAAAVLAAKATLARVEDAEAFGLLQAPSEGTVLNTLAEPGTNVSAGQPIVTFAAKGEREVVIDVPSAHLPLFEVGALMRVETGFGPVQAGPVQTGHVRLIEPVSNATSRAHRLRISLDDQSIRLGSLVSVSPDLKAGLQVSLPSRAIFVEAGQPHVWRVGEGRKLEARPVTLGPEIDGQVQITQGLSEGDEILLNGLSHASPGLSVGERIAP